MRYAPLLLVIAVRDPCSCGLVAVQVTPGSAAPDVSVTVPVMSPVVWANARLPVAAPTIAIASNGKKNLLDRLIELPPLLFPTRTASLIRKVRIAGSKPETVGRHACWP